MSTNIFLFLYQLQLKNNFQIIYLSVLTFFTFECLKKICLFYNKKNSSRSTKNILNPPAMHLTWHNVNQSF